MTSRKPETLLNELRDEDVIVESVSEEERDDMIEYIENKTYPDDLEPVKVKFDRVLIQFTDDNGEVYLEIYKEVLAKLSRKTAEDLNVKQISKILDVGEQTIHDTKSKYHIYQFTSNYLKNCGAGIDKEQFS